MSNRKDLTLVDRVVINSHGEAVNLRTAVREYNISPDVVFVRNDDWRLGAQEENAGVAYGLWSDCWTHFYTAKEMELKPISEYEQD